MINANDIKKTLFFDIETTSNVESYLKLNSTEQNLWKERHIIRYQNSDSVEPSNEDLKKSYERNATWNPEWGFVVCISCGIERKGKIETKSFSGNENEVLIQFFDLINRLFTENKFSYLCGHNIINYGIPFLIKRFLINGNRYSDLPRVLQIVGKKPWEMNQFLDTKVFWEFGTKIFPSTLEESCYHLNIKTPKDDMSGKDVWSEYHQKKNIEGIVEYCEKDVVAVYDFLKRIFI